MSKRKRNNHKKNKNNNGQVYREGELFDRKKFHIHDIVSVCHRSSAQLEVFRSFSEGQHLVLKGAAGTGKTFVAMYLGLMEVLDPDVDVDKLIIVRSNVPTRDLGHLPGELEDKMGIYEDPYRQICDELFKYSKSYDNMKTAGYIKFLSTSYLRGLTFNNAIVIVDEFENCNSHELDSIITRLGKNSRIIFSGDFAQTDFTRSSEKNSTGKWLDIIKRVESFDIHDFSVEDIVRSGVVKEYLIAKYDSGVILYC